MSSTRDWSIYISAGLLDPDDVAADDRKALIDFLAEQGCTIEEMIAANHRGRLFGLAGDRLVRPGARTLTLREVAEATGADEALARRLWRALGLEGWDSELPLASPDDAAACGMILAAVAFVGEDAAMELARSVGAGLAQIAEALQAVGRTVSSSGSVATSGSELETARFWAANAPFVAAMGGVLDAFSRHHWDLARTHFERSGSYDVMLQGRARVAVGFIDMSGFTTAATELGDADFEQLVRSFVADVSETVQDLGGRVVKFAGDAAMVVAPDAVMLATIARHLVVERSRGGGLALHAGLAYGEVLTRLGDYFGRPVNLAARLAALAETGSVLATAEVGAALVDAGWAVEQLAPQPIRGIAEPVTVYRVGLS